ncbi:chromate transporter [Tunturiibacter gelidoferens]|uniref:chromate transporter n=1 Tax=Tunturiibacter gelidiferens TaxID=3069689 RepID=UPI00161F775A
MILATQNHRGRASALAHSISVSVLVEPSLWFLEQLSFFFKRTAFVTIGSAYNAIPYVDQIVVTRCHWLSQAQMLDGFALAETTQDHSSLWWRLWDSWRTLSNRPRRDCSDVDRGCRSYCSEFAR